MWNMQFPLRGRAPNCAKFCPTIRPQKQRQNIKRNLQKLELLHNMSAEYFMSLVDLKGFVITHVYMQIEWQSRFCSTGH
jgi:hypothetical protein